MTTARSWPRVAAAHAVYDLLFLLALLLAALPFLLRALRDRRLWKTARERLGGLPEGAPAGRPVWIHAVSVGEVKAARPLVRELQARTPQIPLVLSSSTPAGYETARLSFPDLYVFHAPLDLSWIVRHVLRRVSPRLLILMELEVWPALLRAADEAGVAQAIVNGRVTQQSARRYRRWNWWLPEFDRLALVAAQDAANAQRIIGLGVPAERVHVTGNLKHEILEPVSPERSAELARTVGLTTNRPIFVAGSTHDGEDEAVLAAWEAAGGAAVCQLVLVPRHLRRLPDIQRLIERRRLTWRLRSAGTGLAGSEAVLLVDSMGELEGFFALAAITFLGGSLVPVGGHNVLEPAAAGCPILVGPHLESCRAEAELLREAGGLLVTQDAAALTQTLRELLADEPRRRAMGRAAGLAARTLRGAAAADVQLIAERGLLAEPALAGRA
ncbi:MAG: 3-deoxy-D-manno-octulosonic acid transferase [Planctomycetota bacterium]